MTLLLIKMTLKECVRNTPVARITRSNLKLNHKRQTTFKFWARDKLNRFYTLVYIESGVHYIQCKVVKLKIIHNLIILLWFTYIHCY